MKFINWNRQRRIRYPYNVNDTANDNWCAWSDYLPRVKR